MADGVSIYMGNVVQTLKGVDKKFASAVRKEIRKAVTEAGSDITAQVKASASWSTGHTSRNVMKPRKKKGVIHIVEQQTHTSIPAATSMRANFTAKSSGVRIVVNRNKAPHGGLFELGNKGGKVGPGTFKNGTGGVIQKRPFFYKSVGRRTPEAERKFIAAIDAAIAAAIQ